LGAAAEGVTLEEAVWRNEGCFFAEVELIEFSIAVAEKGEVKLEEGSFLDLLPESGCFLVVV
jgi:hypothetical protein